MKMLHSVRNLGRPGLLPMQCRNGCCTLGSEASSSVSLHVIARNCRAGIPVYGLVGLPYSIDQIQSQLSGWVEPAFQW
jgi:hypothetical protein